MDTFRDVIDLWGTRVALAADLGVSPVRISTWRHRNSIPGEWFRRVAEAAAKAGHDRVTVDYLARIAEARSLSTSKEAA